MNTPELLIKGCVLVSHEVDTRCRWLYGDLHILGNLLIFTAAVTIRERAAWATGNPYERPGVMGVQVPPQAFFENRGIIIFHRKDCELNEPAAEHLLRKVTPPPQPFPITYAKIDWKNLEADCKEFSTSEKGQVFARFPSALPTNRESVEQSMSRPQQEEQPQSFEKAAGTTTWIAGSQHPGKAEQEHPGSGTPEHPIIHTPPIE